MDSQVNSGKSANLIAVIVILALLLAAAAGFAYWAFNGRQDYKNNTDKKVALAVAAAKKTEAASLKTQFDQAAKSPYKAYRGSSTYGSVTFAYPKTWSAYVDESNSSEPINGYFHPNIVPGTQSNTAYALRLELLSTPYDQVVKQATQKTGSSPPVAKAYVPPKMAKVANVQPGLKLDGSIGQDHQGHAINGSMVIIKVRDKTLQISTQSTNFLNDFNNIILASLTFVP
jgi:hypothetical protein